MFDLLTEENKPVHIYCTVNISKMAYKDLKKWIRWLWKKELDRSKKQEKELEYNVLKINTGETKNSNNKFFKGMCKNFGKYGHKATNFWGNKKKYKRRTRFSGEYNNCVKKGHSGVDCWAKKIEKEDDMDNLF